MNRIAVSPALNGMVSKTVRAECISATSRDVTSQPEMDVHKTCLLRMLGERTGILKTLWHHPLRVRDPRLSGDR